MKWITCILFVSVCVAIATPCGFAQSGTITTYAGSGTYGFSGDYGPAISAQFGFPAGIAVDAAGNLFIADSDNQRIRKVTPDGVIRTIAGEHGLTAGARRRSADRRVLTRERQRAGWIHPQFDVDQQVPVGPEVLDVEPDDAAERAGYPAEAPAGRSIP